jgi:hypothetical protein
MKQKITIEKNRELELKKTMLNFKNFSLMKKQLFSLVMMLALVVLAGTSARAQQIGAVNDATHGFVMVAGSTHDLSITPSQADNGFSWTLYDISRAQACAVAQATMTNETTATATIAWTQNSIGQYYAQVVETRNGVLCANTTRRFYITIIDFDILVYAADDAGERISGGSLLACGNGTTARYGDIGTAGSADAFSNAFQNPTDIVPNALDTYTGTAAPRTVRYVGFQIIWNLGTTGVTPPAVNNILVDYAVSVDDANGASAYVLNTDFVSIDGNTNATGTGLEITSTGANTLAAADFNCLLLGAAKGATFFVPIVINDRWSSSDVTDLLLNFNATNIVLQYDDGSTISVIGTEPDAYELPAAAYSSCVTLATNMAEQQTIQLAPATTTITAN